MGIRTVSGDVTVLIFSQGEQGRPCGEVMQIEIDVIILGERVKICEIHFE